MESQPQQQTKTTSSMGRGGGGGGVGGGGVRNYWGNHPEKEEEFYASEKVRSTSSFFTSPTTGLPLFTRSWLPLHSGPDDQQPRGLVFMLHGYGNDISWTFQSTPIFLAQHGFACFALDLPGHGRSYGLKAFVPDLNSVIHDCASYFTSVIRQQQQQYSNSDYCSSSNPKCFLYGESMGGAICLLIHLLLRDHPDAYASDLEFHGAVLVAPMCKISDGIRPRWPIPAVLTLAAKFFPTLPVVPTADLVHKSVKVEEKKVIALSNPLRYGGKPRLGTVLELLRATDDLSKRLSDVSIPFIVLHGSTDAVTDPEVSRELHEKASSRDKSIKIYDGMMHSLLFGETDENVDAVRKDILAWLEARSSSNSSS